MRRFLAVVLVSFTAHVPLAAAQDASRIDQLEEQIRQLTGQVEELTFAVKQLQGTAATARKSAVLQPAQPAPKSVASTEPLPQLANGIEVIEEQPLVPAATQQQAPAKLQAAAQVQPQADAQAQDSIYGDAPVAAPGPTKLGAMANAAAQPNDGGFQGQVVDDPNAQLAVNGPSGGQVQQASLAEETPEALYKRSDEALLRRQFGDAEVGFKKFLATYPNHSLAGSAQYWLGETYYAQGDYKTAAQNFMAGYQKYSKSRRAPDSLLKLGIALNKLGQKEQACTFLGSVGGEYPNAVEANKRAQSEFKRAGC